MTLLQFVQKAAACLVSGARRHDHITRVLCQMHWLPVQKRVDFKMATLVYRSLSDMAPAYQAAECQLVSEEGHHQLRYASPKLLNSLPAGLRQMNIGYEQLRFTPKMTITTVCVCEHVHHV